MGESHFGLTRLSVQVVFNSLFHFSIINHNGKKWLSIAQNKQHNSGPKSKQSSN